MMMMMMMMMMMIIIITFKGAFRDFLQSPHCAANCLHHVQGAVVRKSRATLLALTTGNMPRATWYEGTAQLLSLTELKSHLFQFCFTGGND